MFPVLRDVLFKIAMRFSLNKLGYVFLLRRLVSGIVFVFEVDGNYLF